MTKKAIAVVTGILCGIISSLVYYIIIHIIIHFILSSAFPIDITLMALLGFLIAAVLNYFLYKYLRKINKIFAYAYIIQTIPLHVISLYALSISKHFFD